MHFFIFNYSFFIFHFSFPSGSASLHLRFQRSEVGYFHHFSAIDTVSCCNAYQCGHSAVPTSGGLAIGNLSGSEDLFAQANIAAAMNFYRIREF